MRNEWNRPLSRVFVVPFPRLLPVPFPSHHPTLTFRYVLSRPLWLMFPSRLPSRSLDAVPLLSATYLPGSLCSLLIIPPCASLPLAIPSPLLLSFRVLSLVSLRCPPLRNISLPELQTSPSGPHRGDAASDDDETRSEARLRAREKNFQTQSTCYFPFGWHSQKQISEHLFHQFCHRLMQFQNSLTSLSSKVSRFIDHVQSCLQFCFFCCLSSFVYRDVQIVSLWAASGSPCATWEPFQRHQCPQSLLSVCFQQSWLIRSRETGTFERVVFVVGTPPRKFSPGVTGKASLFM